MFYIIKRRDTPQYHAVFYLNSRSFIRIPFIVKTRKDTNCLLNIVNDKEQ